MVIVVERRHFYLSLSPSLFSRDRPSRTRWQKLECSIRAASSYHQIKTHEQILICWWHNRTKRNPIDKHQCQQISKTMDYWPVFVMDGEDARGLKQQRINRSPTVSSIISPKASSSFVAKNSRHHFYLARLPNQRQTIAIDCLLIVLNWLVLSSPDNSPTESHWH